jgi:GTPase SAR1 family protein
MKKIVFLGTAGAGKSTLTAALVDWMQDNGYDAALMNLDPGVEQLNYDADIDIRDWVKLEDVMREYNLGPNGAQVAAADLIALNMNKLMEPLEQIESDYLLVDTPGQLELFAYRQSGKVVLERLGLDETMVAFISDPAMCKTPSSFVSSALLFASINFRLQVPSIHILSKTDILTEEEYERIMLWSQEEDALYSALLDEESRASKSLNTEVFRALQQLSAYSELIPVSSKEFTGLEDIYARAQGIFEGGEDLERR